MQPQENRTIDFSAVDVHGRSTSRRSREREKELVWFVGGTRTNGLVHFVRPVIRPSGLPVAVVLHSIPSRPVAFELAGRAFTVGRTAFRLATRPICTYCMCES